jgi:chromosome segregation ATPase
MMALATRIQERARTLREEQQNLQKMTLQLEQTRKAKEQELKTNRAHRQNQLKGAISRSQVELDLFRAQDRVQGQRAKNDNMEVGTKTVKEETEQIQSRLQKDIENVYAPHEMEMEKYRKMLECKTQKAQKRQDEIDKIESNIRRLKQAERELLEDRKSLIADCENLQREDGIALQEIENLSAENKQLLSQVRENHYFIVCQRSKELASMCSLLLAVALIVLF